MRLFLCGDVMTGRGIDQIMPRPCDPVLYEPHVRSALGYVALAECVSGEIPRVVSADYVWGDALAEIERREADVRIINLETSITADGTPEPKGINYRMHPDNVGCLVAADIDCCILANNHVLDWGQLGLLGTLTVLDQAEIAVAGAGRDAAAAAQPAMLAAASGRRLLVFALACPSSGVPPNWAAGATQPGVSFLPDLGRNSVTDLKHRIDAFRLPGDLILLSIHWGPNWGYDIPSSHRHFARDLVEMAGVDVVHGHSSHHPLAIEVHGGKPIIYGCGDFINDYEGISGHEAFRPDLAVAYFLDVGDRGQLLDMELVPFRLQKFRLARTSREDAGWLAATLDRECRRFGHHVHLTQSEALALWW